MRVAGSDCDADSDDDADPAARVRVGEAPAAAAAPGLAELEPALEVPDAPAPAEPDAELDVEVAAPEDGGYGDGAGDSSADTSDASDTSDTRSNTGSEEEAPDPEPIEPAPALGRGHRIRSAPFHMLMDQQRREQVRLAVERPQRLRRRDFDVNVAEAIMQSAFAAAQSEVTLRDPQTYAEARVHPQWVQAMDEEFSALESTGTFEWCALPPDRRLIKGKWVYKTKFLMDGNVERFKARFCAKGFSQIEGVDFTETFAPTAQRASFRVLLGLRSALNLQFEHMDASSAFLQGDLEEVIYIEPPAGYERVDSSGRPLVWRLLRPLYGLKQSPRQWNVKLHKTLKDLGFVRLGSDSCLYLLVRGDSVVFLLLHVDDLAMAHNSASLSREVKAALTARLKFKDLGQLQYFTGFELRYDGLGGVHLSQAAYARAVLTTFGMLDAHPHPIPMDAHVSLLNRQPEEPECSVGIDHYRSAVGSLQYLVNTRPDIAFAVGAVARHVASPSEAHWQAVMKIFRYVRGTQTYGIYYPSSSPTRYPPLLCYTDADWAGDRNDRRSTSGFACFLGESLVAFGSKKQASVAISTCEAEYLAAGSCVQEILWLRQLLSELHMAPQSPTPLAMDNKSAIAFIANPITSARSKHIDIKHHFIREQAEFGALTPHYVKSSDNVADIFTKALAKPAFLQLRDALGVMEPG